MGALLSASVRWWPLTDPGLVLTTPKDGVIGLPDRLTGVNTTSRKPVRTPGLGPDAADHRSAWGDHRRLAQCRAVPPASASEKLAAMRIAAFADNGVTFSLSSSLTGSARSYVASPLKPFMLAPVAWCRPGWCRVVCWRVAWRRVAWRRVA